MVRRSSTGRGATWGRPSGRLTARRSTETGRPGRRPPCGHGKGRRRAGARATATRAVTCRARPGSLSTTPTSRWRATGCGRGLTTSTGGRTGTGRPTGPGRRTGGSGSRAAVGGRLATGGAGRVLGRPIRAATWGGRRSLAGRRRRGSPTGGGLTHCGLSGGRATGIGGGRSAGRSCGGDGRRDAPQKNRQSKMDEARVSFSRHADVPRGKIAK